jgi:hypothetical protein
MAGQASVEDAVVWADGIIMAEPEPDASFLDISLAGRRGVKEVVRLLRAVPGETSSIEVMRACLGHMLNALRSNPGCGRTIAQWLYRRAIEGELPETEFGWEPRWLEDWFIAGDSNHALAELDGYLSRHAEPVDS